MTTEGAFIILAMTLDKIFGNSVFSEFMTPFVLFFVLTIIIKINFINVKFLK